MYFKVGLLKDFANFTKKKTCWSLILNHAGLRRHRWFPLKIAKFLTTFLQNTSGGCFLIKLNNKDQREASVDNGVTPIDVAIVP